MKKTIMMILLISTFTAVFGGIVALEFNPSYKKAVNDFLIETSPARSGMKDSFTRTFQG